MINDHKGHTINKNPKFTCSLLPSNNDHVDKKGDTKELQIAGATLNDRIITDRGDNAFHLDCGIQEKTGVTPFNFMPLKVSCFIFEIDLR